MKSLNWTLGRKQRRNCGDKNYIESIVVYALLLIAALFTLANIGEIPPDVSFQSSTSARIETVTDVIYDDMSIEQVFTATTDDIASVEAMIGTYMRTNYFLLRLEVYEEESNVLLTSCEINASKLIDNAYEQFNFDPIQTVCGKQYRIVFRSEGANSENTVAFYRTGDDTADAVNHAQINGSMQSYHLAVKVTSSGSSSPSSVRNFIILFAALLALIIIIQICLMLKKKRVFDKGLVGFAKKLQFIIKQKEFQSIAKKYGTAILIGILLSFAVEIAVIFSLPPMDDSAINSSNTFGFPIYWKQWISVNIIFILLSIIAASQNIIQTLWQRIKNVGFYISQPENICSIFFIGFLLCSSMILERLVFGLIWGREFQFSQYWLILTITGIPLAFYRFQKQIGRHVEIGFLIISLSIGILLISTIPKCSIVSWDEAIHFERTIGVAGLGVERMTSADIITQTLGANFDPEIISGRVEMLNEKFAQGSVREIWTGFFYDQLGYLPAALGIFFGRLFRCPYHVIFLMGKFLNLLSYVMLVYFSIRRLKSGKVILSIIALFPTNLFLASNYSYDPWVTGWFILGFSNFVSELQQPNKLLNWKTSTGLILPFLIGCGPKAVYAPFMLILLLMHRKKFFSDKHSRWFRILVLYSTIIAILSFLAPFLTQIGAGEFVGDTRGYSDVDSGKQVIFILKNPISYAVILLRFLVKEYLTFDASALYMTEFAYLGNAGKHVLLVAALMVAVFTDKNEYDLKMMSSKFRVNVLLAFFVTVCAVASALYVSFTPVGEATVYGCQLRYLLPILFPVYFVIGSPHVENHMNKNLYNTVLLFVRSCQAWTHSFL